MCEDLALSGFIFLNMQAVYLGHLVVKHECSVSNSCSFLGCLGFSKRNYMQDVVQCPMPLNTAHLPPLPFSLGLHLP